MAGKTRNSGSLTVDVRLPARLVEALDGHVSCKSPGTRLNASSRGAVATELLRRVLRELANARSDISQLLLVEAVRESALRSGERAPSRVRRELGARRGSPVDRAIATLEREGFFAQKERPVTLR